jgi:hypothetical protein
MSEYCRLLKGASALHGLLASVHLIYSLLCSPRPAAFVLVRSPRFILML